MEPHNQEQSGKSSFQRKLYRVIFEADTPAGKTFDVALLITIILSVFTVILESVPLYNHQYHQVFLIIEWVVTILFSIEYFLRIYCVRSSGKYIWSFYGIVDLLSVLPTYLSIMLPGSQYLLTIRALRLLRIFRIFKMARYLIEGAVLRDALKGSQQKIIVFLLAVLTIVMIIGSTMYLVESGHNSGFSSIPQSMYWTIVTLTTVGYGDITPVTSLGQFIASFLMILGYAMIAVPTGIVSVEMAEAHRRSVQKRSLREKACSKCGTIEHADDAQFCRMCGEGL